MGQLKPRQIPQLFNRPSLPPHAIRKGVEGPKCEAMQAWTVGKVRAWRWWAPRHQQSEWPGSMTSALCDRLSQMGHELAQGGLMQGRICARLHGACL